MPHSVLQIILQTHANASHTPSNTPEANKNSDYHLCTASWHVEAFKLPSGSKTPSTDFAYISQSKPDWGMLLQWNSACFRVYICRNCRRKSVDINLLRVEIKLFDYPFPLLNHVKLFGTAFLLDFKSEFDPIWNHFGLCSLSIITKKRAILQHAPENLPVAEC